LWFTLGMVCPGANHIPFERIKDVKFISGLLFKLKKGRASMAEGGNKLNKQYRMGVFY